MAIRFDHPAAAGMVGAYAEGQAEAKKRQQNVFLTMYERERDRQDRRSLYASRGAGRGSGGGGGEGMWINPMDRLNALPSQDDPRFAEAFEARRMGMARMRANERDIRQGRAPRYQELLPRYVSQEQIEQQRENARADAIRQENRQNELDDIQSNRRWQEEQYRLRESQTNRTQMGDRLVQSIPEWAASNPQLLHELQRDANEIATALNDNRINWSDESQARPVYDRIAKFQERIRGLKPPDPIEELDRNTVWYNPETGQRSRQKFQGATPGTIINGQWEPDQAYVERQTTQQEQKQAQAEAKQAYVADLQKRLDTFTIARSRMKPELGVSTAEIDNTIAGLKNELMSIGLQDRLNRVMSARMQMDSAANPEAAAALDNQIVALQSEMNRLSQGDGETKSKPTTTAPAPAQSSSGGDGLQRLIAAARGGNQQAQQLLTSRGVRWQL